MINLEKELRSDFYESLCEELIDILKIEYELFESLYNAGCLLLGSDIESKFKTAMGLKKNAIEKVTGLKIEEIL